MSIGDFPEILSQRILAGTLLAGEIWRRFFPRLTVEAFEPPYAVGAGAGAQDGNARAAPLVAHRSYSLNYLEIVWIHWTISYLKVI